MLKKICVALIFLLVLSFSVTLLGNESAQKYYPSTLDSFWVYEDQDGNKLTGRAIESEEIAGKTFPAFSYEPELEDWTEYNPFMHPFLYQISDAGITLVAGDEAENAFKARLKKEMDTFVDIIKGQVPPEIDLNLFQLDIEIEVQGQDHLFLLPEEIVVNEEWEVNQIEANMKLIPRGADIPGDEQLTIDYTIIETGIVLGTETIETDAGTFEDCLKVEYRTETTAVMTPIPEPDEIAPPGETVTTLWFAPNVGIVKFQEKSGHIFLDMIPDDAGFPIVIPPNPEKIFELKEFEIKTTDSESNGSN